MENQLFNRQTANLLDKLFHNLPGIVFLLTIAIRVLIAVSVALVQIEKFEHYGPIMSMVIGIASIILLEGLLTVLSLINARFRLNDMDDEANWLLIGIIVLVAYNSYLIYASNEIYVIKHEFTAQLTLHVLNIVSIGLIESISAIQVKVELQAKKQVAQQKIEQQKNTEKYTDQIAEEIAEIIGSTDTLEEKIIALKQTNYFVSQQSIAKILNTNKTKVSRTLAATNN